MKKIASLYLAALACLCVLAPNASATLLVTAGVGATPLGNTNINFDNLPIGNSGGVSGGIAVSFVPDGEARTGATSGISAAPFLSNNNGVPFGDPTNGVDQTVYLTTGIGKVILDLPGDHNYIGLLWGSVDLYNTLEFFDNGISVGAITGASVTAAANGDQGANGTFYVNIVSDFAFDRLVASSSQYAFEFDNVSLDTPPNDPSDPTVPEPATLTLLGLGISTFGAIRRKKAAKANC